jgi:hypothetical protein
MRITLLMLLLCGTLGAQSYSVSDGGGAYPSIVGATWLSAAHDDATTEISPPGFSFDFFGQAFTSFRICTNGHIQLGNGTFGFSASKTPDHGACGNQIACLWTDLIVGQSSALRWKFDGTVLYVEWMLVLQEFGPAYQPIPFPGVNMQTQLDTSTGQITLYYGDPSPLAASVTETAAGAVAISGAPGAAQEVITGVMPGYVNADGSVGAYPIGRWIRFTPPANNLPAISVASNGAAVSGGGTLTAPLGSTLAGLGLQIDVTDADGDTVALTGTVGNAGTSGMLESEFSNSAAAPFALTPTSGSFGALVTHAVSLQADDGRGGTATFNFTIVVDAGTGGGQFTGGARGGGGAGCTAGAGSLAWLAILPLLLRRRRNG